MKTILIQGNPYGLFSSIVETIDNLKWCDRNNYTPVVNFRRREDIPITNHGMDMGYHANEGTYNGGDNVWEYYFEPINRDKEQLATEYVWNHILLKETPISFGYRCPKHSGLHHKPDWVTVHQDEGKWRKEVHGIIKKYVHPKKSILDKVDNFYNQNLQHKKFKIAIHIRGGRGAKELKNHKDNVNLKYYVDCVKRFLKRLNSDNFVIYVASDNDEAINFVNENLSNVVYYPCRRTKNHYIGEEIIGRLKTNDYAYDDVVEMTNRSMYPNERANVGEEVIIESLLLSKCDIMFHHESLVACMATYWNLDLETSHIEDYLIKKGIIK